MGIEERCVLMCMYERSSLGKVKNELRVFMELPAGMGRLRGEGGHGNDGDMLVWTIVFCGG